MKHRYIYGFLLVFVTIAFWALSPLGALAAAVANDAQWGRYISHHSTGEVSRKAKLRIVFANDMVGPLEIGKPFDSLHISPRVAVDAYFENARELVIVPKSSFNVETLYSIKVAAKDFQQIPDNLGEFSFNVKIMKQDFEVRLDNLVPSSGDDNAMLQSGSLITRDVEAPLVEMLLSAKLDGKFVKLVWSHNPDGRHHDFKVSGIARRQNESRKLVFYWNGYLLGIDNEGKREVDIPSVAEFKVVEVVTRSEKGQYVRIVFSDALDSAQNLNGLVTLSTGSATFRVEGNAINAYPQNVSNGSMEVTVHPGVRGEKGQRLGNLVRHTIMFLSQKPAVRFVGKGVIMPDNRSLTIPFEAVNVNAVQVTAFEIYEDNLGQFFQTNKYDGRSQLGRVGRYIWRKTIALPEAAPDKWGRFTLDATELLQKHPGTLFRLTLSINRGNSLYSCSRLDTMTPPKPAFVMKNLEALHQREHSGWDGIESYYGRPGNWNDRKDPCKDAYYRYSNETKSSRNFLASNIGIIAKRGAGGKVDIVTTNIRTAAPLGKVAVTFYNFQNQSLGEVTTNGEGFAEAMLDGVPFYLTADKGRQRGYLKMSPGLALPTSHFDVGGEEVRQGIKGHIYAERGVWRPGDNIYLTLVIEDKDGRMPDNHPVTMELYNPKGQMVRSVTNTKPVGDFYAFNLRTSKDDITGSWTAMARVGGLSYSRKLKIETVVPNRLKLNLDVGGDILYQHDMPLDMKIFGQWLHGATASGLKTDVSVRLRSRATSFGRFKDHVFDDPARDFSSVKQKVFEGKLDSGGNVSFKGNIVADNASPGMLAAHFFSRIFEEGGAFSSSTFSVPFHPYRNYVGIKLPKGDRSRGMLLTDTKHKVSIATLDDHGNPVSLKNIRITLYKISWKWWWDKSSDSLANYSSARHSGAIMQDSVSTVNGEGSWEFEVKYPQWGRYLMRVCDLEGGHCTGKVFYMDWPGWAGRAREEKGAGASALTLYTDKARYTVGETATVVIPSAKQGRALMSLESGTRLMEQRWIKLSGKETRIPIKITSAMAPNIYVNVMMIQPHVEKKNDLPIRLYGIVPIEVEAPATVLHPVIKTSDEYSPQARVNISVSEASGRPMTYTLALVDEGLLGLTNFRTPELHGEFYKREALGVRTWDLFDEVVGAYGGQLERLLSLGGDEGLVKDDQKKDRRFPPVVRFLGPFKLKKGQRRSHGVDLPLYVGAVRVMVVAGRAGSYGSAEKSVPVRQPLMIQSTLPRVLGPGEQLTVPVSIFTANDAIKSVKLSLKADSEFFSVVGDSSVIVPFEGKGEKIGFLHLRTREKPGMARLSFKARGGAQNATEEISIEIRSPNERTLKVQRGVMEPGRSWEARAVPHGLAGTNRTVLEVSAVPPFDLEKRLRFLIRYPHGCIEQTTSSVFPQLYLPRLVSLEPVRRKMLDRNIVAGIDRLMLFQLPGGAFSYWPNSGGPSTWGTNYAGHFLIEAERLGYQVPGGMKQAWLNYQKSAARAWTTGGKESTLEQAYRLYTLALAGSPELGAMNRLRESGRLSNTARWQLATAYQIVGLAPVARDLVASASLDGDGYNRGEGRTYGSALRDRSIILLGLVAQNDYSRAREMFELMASDLAGRNWYSTQTTAYALLAMAEFIGGGGKDSFEFKMRVNSGKAESISSSAPIVQQDLARISESGGSLRLDNTGEKVLYATLISEGVPASGNEVDSSEGLSMSTRFVDADGREVDPARVVQGTDIWAEITVRNLKQRRIENLALSQMVPSGWQIHNARLNEGVRNTGLDYQDIRDDRVLSYFSLKPGEARKLKMLVNASFLGHYYLPGWTVEAMYEATVNARLRGRWVDIVK